MAAEPAVVVEILPNAAYRVELGNRERVVAHLSPGRDRNFVRLRLRDEVLVERTALDPARARIIELVRGRSRESGS